MQVARVLLLVLLFCAVNWPGSAHAQQVEELAAAARAAAAEERHDEAVRLYEELFALEPGRRVEWLREYADQVAFSGEPAAAIPLYEELLRAEDASDQDRQAAARGRAFALLWSGQFAEAAAAWREIWQRHPGDNEARDALFEALVGAARAAAGEDDNEAAAAHFAEAIEVAPDRRMEIAREYADQLAFAGRVDRAVEVYRSVLADQDVDEDERQRALVGMGRALLWSERFTEAISVWEDVAAADLVPEAQQALADALIGAGRTAAGEQRHQDAAAHFRRAVEVAPERRREVLREYADQLAFAGQLDRAIPLYREAVRLFQDEPAEQRRAERGLGFALLWSGRFADAIVILERIASADPADREAREGWAEAVIGAAREAGAAGRHAEAAALFERAFAIAPERRRGLLREYADQLAFSGRPAEAVPYYQEVLMMSLPAEERRITLLHLANALTWSGRPAEAMPIYDRLVAEAPDDMDVRLARAEALNALERHAEALAEFELVLQARPDSEQAIRGAAQAETSMGRHRAALDRLAPLLLRSDAEPATLMVAAHASRWMGRPDRAELYAQAVLQQEPTHEGAQSLLGELHTERRPLTRTEAWHAWDADDLHIDHFLFSHQLTFNAGLTDVSPTARLRRYYGSDHPDVDVYSVGAGLRHRFNDWLELRGIAFLDIEVEPIGTHVTATYDALLTYLPDDHWRFGLRTARRNLEEPEAIVRNIYAHEVGGVVDFLPTQDLRFSGQMTYGNYTDGNERWWGQVAGAKRVIRNPDLWLGVRYTAFSFREEFDNGYWNPDRFQQLQATVHFHGEITPRLRFDWSAAAG